MRKFASKDAQKGQVLLLVVLASVIALTVGLAAVSRSITSTRISSEESNSQKALSAAEAGIEQQINRALNQNIVDQLNRDLNNNSSFISDAVEDNPGPGDPFDLNNGEEVKQDEGADIWLSDYPDFTNQITTSADITLTWQGSSNCSEEPAIEIAVIWGSDKNNPNMSRFAVDKCYNDPARNNSFDNPTVSGNNRSYTFTAPANSYIARVIPLYNNAKITVESPADLPNQGYIIESTGRSGETARKLQVYQGFPKLPIEFFPYNLFLP